MMELPLLHHLASWRPYTTLIGFFVIDTYKTYAVETPEVPTPTQTFSNEQDGSSHRLHDRFRLLGQVLRFGLVGGLNTLVDLLILNGLLWLFPTTSTLMLLAYNFLAYSMGAVNSFLLNKYWTFGSRQKMIRGELARFTLTTLCGIGWSSAILWLASTLLHPILVNATVWANASKVVAIVGTALISYLGMRLWVFVSTVQRERIRFPAHTAYGDACDKHGAWLPRERRDITGEHEQCQANEDGEKTERSHSLSIVLPAYNEEAVIGTTLERVLNVLAGWVKDIEVIVVNDGSIDRTGAIISALVEAEQRVRVVTHEHNQGYGAALADGFAAASKELTFFMDSDGQFDIRDLSRLLLFIDEYDAVIGYRLERQDSWMRKLNAWGWNVLTRNVLGIHVRDIDCAFKLLHTDFLHRHPLETRGAMINAELLYRLTRAGYTYREVGVHHLSRQGGRATGANLRVIVCALRELFLFARKWEREEKVHTRYMLVSENHPF
jgi:putative flippase GtrA